MTLETVWGGAPEVPCVEVLGLPSSLEPDHTIGLGGDVPPAEPVPGVDVYAGVGPGPQRVRGHPHLGPGAGLAEAAGVAVEEVVPAAPREQDRGLVTAARRALGGGEG